MARRRASAPFDVPTAAAAAQHARRRTKWMSDDAATLAVAALEHHPHPDRMTQEEVRQLVDAIGTELNAAAHQHSVNIKVGGEDVSCRYREIRIGGETLNYSPRVPGLYRQGEMVDEPGIVQKARRLVERNLSALRYKGPPVTEVRPRAERGRYGFDSLEVVTLRPEGGGTCGTWGFFEHLPEDEIEANAAKVAKEIHLRHRHRHQIAGRIHGARLWIEEALADAEGIDGMVLEDVRVSSIYYKNDDLGSLQVYCTLTSFGNTLQPTTINVSAHSDDHLRKMMNAHRKALRKLDSGGVVEDTRTVDPVVAAAIRANMELYGEGMLAEIEAVIAGRHVKPSNPVKRGISMFNMKDGELTGPVTLKRGKEGVRLHKGRINAKAVRGLPDTMKNALPGMRMRDVIDHPWLEGLVIQSMTINSIGLNLRPKPMSLPLQPLLEELRACVARRRAKA